MKKTHYLTIGFLIITGIAGAASLSGLSRGGSQAKGRAASADLTCAGSATLESLVTCIRNQMPQEGSGGFVAPSAAEQDAWRDAATQMLQGSCDFTLTAALSGVAQVKTFTDAGNNRNYCALVETQDANNDSFVDRGWGAFIVYAGATRELSHQAPHPVSDYGTELQAVSVFKGTDSRSFLMAGAHRFANVAMSSCRSAYRASDVAHNIDNMFHQTNIALNDFYGANPWNAIQWHGMAAGTCASTEVYPSHGRVQTPAASDKISELRNNLLVYHPAWDVDLPGSGVCDLNATQNVQGRLLNGVPPANLCDNKNAPSYTGKFIHIEQDPSFRAAGDWIGPITATWP